MKGCDAVKTFFITIAVATLLLTGCGHETKARTWSEFTNPLTEIDSRLTDVDASVQFPSFLDVAVAYNINIGKLFAERHVSDKMCMYVHPSMLNMQRTRLRNGYMVTGPNAYRDDVFFVHTKLNRNGSTCTRGFTVCVASDVPEGMTMVLFTAAIRTSGVNDAGPILSVLFGMPGHQRLYVDPQTNVVYVMAVNSEYTSVSFLVPNCPDTAE